MKSTKITPEFLEHLGNAVLDFGFMENILRSMILVLSSDRELAKALIPPGRTVTENLDTLRRLCHSRIAESALPDWIAAIDDVRSLFDERNRIFHGLFFEDASVLYLEKHKKGKGGDKDRFHINEFDTDLMPQLLGRLMIRRRQFMDFISDFRESEEGNGTPPSQDTHPYLRINEAPK